jgi:stage II sporulation protein M
MEQKEIEYLYSLKKYILTMLIVFIFSMIIGLVISAKNPGLSQTYLNNFEGSFSWIKTLNPLLIMFIIFLNNAIKSLFALVLGIGFGIVPILFVAGNGMILSILADVVSKQHSVIFVVAATLPHGIIEIPMVLISSGIGLRLGHVMYLSLKGVRNDLRRELKSGIRFYMRVIVPLLFVAAIVETFVTPLIAIRFMT